MYTSLKYRGPRGAVRRIRRLNLIGSKDIRTETWTLRYFKDFTVEVYLEDLMAARANSRGDILYHISDNEVDVIECYINIANKVFSYDNG